jgi:putative transposase
MALVEALSRQVGISQACQALDVPRSWYYRAQRERQTCAPPAAPERPSPKHALGAGEKAAVRDLLNSERFMDQPPREVYATLLDEGQYLCHWRTMYRVLAEYDEVRERRDQRRRPHYQRPQLLAREPNEVWSWDISWLKGPARLVYYYLYVILDIFSRYVVGWMIAEEEAGTLAKQFIAATCAKQGIAPEQLTLHADRGAPMRATSVVQLLEKLGVDRSHSRPYTSDDNPFSEAQFKTMKYHPDYPERFESLAQARAWARAFFGWYNNDHHHVGLGLMAPAVVHYGQAEAVRAQRQQVLDAAYARHPERFVQGPPVAAGPPAAVWINPPLDTAFSGPAPAETKPGAQPRSSASALEAGEHLAIMEPALWPLWEEKSSLILIGELSQSL